MTQAPRGYILTHGGWGYQRDFESKAAVKAESSRRLLKWLKKNDPNGDYDDHDWTHAELVHVVWDQSS